MNYAVVHGAKTANEVVALLPSNYNYLAGTFMPDGTVRTIISGEDVAGWTLDDYVIPRLASALLTVEKVRDLEHAVERTSGVMN